MRSRCSACACVCHVAPRADVARDLRARAATEKELQAAMTALRRKTKVTPQKAQLTAVYMSMLAAGRVPPSPALRALLVKKQSKSQSGVLVRLRTASHTLAKPPTLAADALAAHATSRVAR